MATKPLNYTTKVPVRQTVGECTDLLAEAGADAVTTMLIDKIPVGLRFHLRTPSGMQVFSMPVDIDAICKMLADAYAAGLLRDQSIKKATYLSREHATRVGWRIVKDWLEAQVALIQVGLVSLDQVMLPYLQVEGGSLYELIRDNHLALPGSDH